MDNLRQGTPKTMKEAITNALIKPQPVNVGIEVLREHLRDYIAQKFSVAMMQAKDEAEQARIKKLFNEVVNEGL